MNTLSGKVITITGGCGDIGTSTALLLRKAGAEVALLDISAHGACDSRKKTGKRSSLDYITCDVRDRSSVEAAFDHVMKRYKRLDVVIANAGIVANEPFLKIKTDNWQRTLDVNLTGAFHTAQVAARIMVRQKLAPNGLRGKILFTGSWVQDMPWPEGTAYISSKSGIKMMARVMAQELARSKILVNVLAPGLVMAGLTKKIYESSSAFRRRVGLAIPLGKMQTTRSVADGYLFLCGDQSNYMTGADLLVDGGATLVPR